MLFHSKKSALIILVGALFSFCASASTDITKYKSSALEKNLWQDPYWQKLLHYEKKMFGGYQSEADAKSFFLSPSGKNNPKDELLKNIELLFDVEKKYSDFNDHPACKFPLRYQWLREKLNIAALPHDQLDCKTFHSWMNALGADGISMIFASSYTNNPASMFGHTFLRLHRRQNNIDLPDMLHYTVNFAAQTGEEKGMLYTIKGLFGAYPGYFSTYPYYIKIQQYNNIESRDLWEYKLNLTPEQLQKVVFHLWEMGSAYFWYFFGDENCSYFLLSLLELADEKIQLLNELPFFTIPIDTLKIVKKKSPWVEPPHFRPSLQKRYEASFSSFDKIEKKTFENLIENQNTEILKSISENSQAKVLDTATDYLLIKEKKNEKTNFQNQLMDIRSGISETYESPKIKLPADPLLTHDTERVGLGASKIESEYFSNLDFRGVYHDLLDNPAGFDSSAQIQAMEGRIRVSMKNGDVALDHLKLIEVVSLNPISKYLSKPSWNVGFGWRKNFSEECFDCGSFYLEGGPGLTLGTSRKNRFYFTMFGNAFFQAGPWNQTGYQIGPSGTSMMVMDVTKNSRFMISGNTRYSPFGEPKFIYKTSLESALDLSRSFSLRAWVNLYKESHEFGSSLFFYF